MGLRILVVDDESQICRTLALLLEDEGHDVTCADSGRAALQHLEEREFDLLMVDLRMPGLSGIDTWKLARERRPDLPAILMTAALEGAELAEEHGLHFLPKPFSPALLEARIRAATARSHRRP